MIFLVRHLIEELFVVVGLGRVGDGVEVEHHRVVRPGGQGLYVSKHVVYRPIEIALTTEQLLLSESRAATEEAGAATALSGPDVGGRVSHRLEEQGVGDLGEILEQSQILWSRATLDILNREIQSVGGDDIGFGFTADVIQEGLFAVSFDDGVEVRLRHDVGGEAGGGLTSHHAFDRGIHGFDEFRQLEGSKERVPPFAGDGHEIRVVLLQPTRDLVFPIRSAGRISAGRLAVAGQKGG